MAEIKGEDDMDGEDKLSDAFVFLLADTEEEDQTQHSDAFFTSVEALLTQPTAPFIPHAEELVNSLNTQALIHQLTTQSPTDPLELPDPLEQDTADPHTLATESTSRYGSHRFYGVVIDTGASKYSTAGYGQF